MSDESSVMVLNGGNVLSAPARTEIDIQIATAKRYPRIVSKCLMDAEGMATVDEATAESCGYLFTRENKQIAGPSIRCAEILECAWGNFRAGARVVEITDTHVTAEGMAFDLENNVCNNAVKTLKIVYSDKSGKKGRFSEDMIALTCDRACALAKRNAVFATIPRSYVDRIYRAAMKVAVGDAKSLTVKRGQLLERFQRNWGITAEQVCAYLGKAKPDDLDMDDMEAMIGLGTAIKDGAVTIDEVKSAADVAAQEAAYKPDPATESANRDEAVKKLNGLAEQHGIAPGKLLDKAKAMFRRPLSKLAASEIELMIETITREKTPPAPSERDKLIAEIARVAENVTAEKFDAACVAVHQGVGDWHTFTDDELRALVLELS